MPKSERKIPKLQCIQCQKIKSRTAKNFYKSNNSKHNNKTCEGFANICKGCLKEMCTEPDGKTINFDNFIQVLKLLNKPFIKEEYLKCLNDSFFDLGTYLKNISFNIYTKLQFIDSDKTNNESIEKNNNISNFIVTPEIVIKWGQGYSNKDYEILENMYKQWTYKNKSDTLAEQKTFKFLCLKEFEIMKTRAEGRPVDKLEDTFIKFMNAANVTPKDANAATDLENSNSLGVWIKDIEKYRPAEYFKDKKKYFDFDHLMDYLNRFIFRPLKNLLTGSREFDKEFNVENVSKEKEDTD